MFSFFPYLVGWGPGKGVWLDPLTLSIRQKGDPGVHVIHKLSDFYYSLCQRQFS